MNAKIARKQVTENKEHRKYFFVINSEDWFQEASFAKVQKEGVKLIGNYKVITLCGSTRFKKEFEVIQRKLTLEGCIVLSVGLFSHSEENGEDWANNGIKEMLDDIHKRKIDISDEIFVINKDGYIGKSTACEIEYAESKGMPIRYMELQT